MKPLLLVLSLLFVAPLLLAAETNSPQTSVAAVTFDQAKAAAKLGNAAAAEQILVAGNTAAPGTYDWEIESAQRLTLLAHWVPREGAAAVAPALISSILNHLASAEALVSDNRRKAIAKALAGSVYENYRGEHALALASYRAAAQLMPEHPVAKQAADRLERLTDNLRSRGLK